MGKIGSQCRFETLTCCCLQLLRSKLEVPLFVFLEPLLLPLVVCRRLYIHRIRQTLIRWGATYQRYRSTSSTSVASNEQPDTLQLPTIDRSRASDLRSFIAPQKRDLFPRTYWCATYFWKYRSCSLSEQVVTWYWDKQKGLLYEYNTLWHITEKLGRYIWGAVFVNFFLDGVLGKNLSKLKMEKNIKRLSPERKLNWPHRVHHYTE